MRTFRLKLSLLLAACACCLLFAGGMLAIGAEAETPFVLYKHTVELEAGGHDFLLKSGTAEFTSEDREIAVVEENGCLNAHFPGETKIIARNGDQVEEVKVTVVEKKQGFDENILLSAFWPPTVEYLDGGEGDERWDEQFALLRDAEIDYLCNVTGRDRQVNSEGHPLVENTKEANLKMAEYAYRYGMRVGVADERFGEALKLLDKDAIKSLIYEYSNIPGVGGYYILDEPYQPLDYAEVYAAMKEADPNGYAHLNFLPMWSYGDPPGSLDGAEETYRRMISAWLNACKGNGYPADYLMYDFYPYGAGESMNRDVFFYNLNVVRELGLEYGVKTAQYLQSVGGAAGGRSPTPAEIRYEAMISLAYGYKQLSYFTWFLPTNRTETFFGAVVDENGVPNEKTYPAICALNREIHTLGETLIHLEAREVYLNGFSDPRAVWGGQKLIPEDFVVQPEDQALYAVSLMKDTRGRQNYLMFVNNDYTKETDFRVKIGGGVRSVYRISSTDGTSTEIPLEEDGTLHVELAAGDGALYALPYDMDFTKPIVDKRFAQEALERYNEVWSQIVDLDTPELDAALEELRYALEDEEVTTERLEILTKRFNTLLDEVLRGLETPPEEEEKPEPPFEINCDSSLGGSGIALAVLASLFLMRKRKE